MIFFVEIKIIYRLDDFSVSGFDFLHDFINHRAIPFVIAFLAFFGSSFLVIFRNFEKCFPYDVAKLCFGCVYVVRINVFFCLGQFLVHLAAFFFITGLFNSVVVFFP